MNIRGKEHLFSPKYPPGGQNICPFFDGVVVAHAARAKSGHNLHKSLPPLAYMSKQKSIPSHSLMKLRVKMRDINMQIIVVFTPRQSSDWQ